jgi:fused signal recognition particle receptor
MEQLLITIHAWSTQAEQFVRDNPERIIQGALGLIVVILLLLLLVARNSRKRREEVQSLRAELERLAVTKRAEVSRLGQMGHERAEVLPEPVAIPTEPVALPTEEVEVVQPPEAPAAEESTIARGMAKSRAGFLSRLAGFFSGKTALDTSMLDDLEEALILSDVGARCAADLVAQVRDVAEKQGQVSESDLRELLKAGIHSHLVPVSGEHRLYSPDRSPLVILVVGVNGVGKTTTVAKLATKYMQQGKKVLAIAADTFRAAAVEQLAEWSNRVGFTLIRGLEEAKPSAVVFDGMVAAKEGNYDVVLIDTAGRLHTKSNLMQELEGVRNVIRKHVPDAPHETILVLDGVSGQNALSQAREFNSAVQLTGIVVTKLDGTPKGGIIVAISQELKLPVLYVGVGEKVGDLVRFDREAFVSALLDEDSAGRGATEMHPAARVGNT